ncbi:glycosyltransferase [Paenibacillus oenotherae]|uniref:Glycosyltransferase n=1 Tax=Paenibacillus oenotherae TaxID=1435645 RepID=A0ABS7D861_9BACL|nr:glycosyltransferase [Paenibacillus oenotherae]MBW7476004.1 glycosyltransferase [Paenibacillus oenotherae]
MTRYMYNEDPKLLILYASYGDGHLQAARAIRDALSDHGMNRAVLVDLLAEAHPWINEMTRLIYSKSFTMLPGLYGWMYDRTKPMKHDSLFAGWLHSFGRDRLRRLLRDEKPDAVIHTFPLLAMPALKQRMGLRIPSCTVVTDFDLHRRWVHPDIDRYYVPTYDMKHELMSLGIHSHRICVSGIPLKRGFRSLSADPSLYVQYSLPPKKPIILIMAGAQGILPDIAELCTRLLAHPDITLAIVCGRSEALAQELHECFDSHPERERLRIFGYIEHIHELMALSTCLVTKPGGVTLSEALAAELPIFTYKPVPGQERHNALYLESKGAAVIAHSPDQLSQEIMKLIHDPIRLLNCKRALHKLRRNDAADTIALDFCPGLNIMVGAPSSIR